MEQSTTFNVRYYECDSHGHLGAANYLRYMQQAAFDAHRAAGYNRQHMADLGLSMLISQSRLQFKRPLFFRNEVVVTTNANAFRRVSYQRGYDFHLADGTQVASGDSEWVLVDAETEGAVDMTPEMMAALAGQGVEPVKEKFTPIAPLPPAPPNVFTFPKEVVWRDVTASRHMDNAVFLEHFTEAGMRVSGHYGWTTDKAIDEGLGWFARSLEIAYHKPLHLNDQVEISTWISEIKTSSVIRNFRMVKAEGDDLISHCRMRLTLVDLNTGRPMRVPMEIRDDFAENILLDEAK